MSDTLLDGHGRGYQARVNSDGMQVTRAVQVTQALYATLEQYYYEATTAQVTLTTANETGLIYILNTSNTNNMVVDRVFIDIWESTGGSGSGLWRYYANPTITGGTTVIPANTNLGSPYAAEVTCLKSLTTMTGTAWYTGQFLAPIGIVSDEGRLIIAPSKSFGITIQAAAGNTSMKVSINVAFMRCNLTDVE